MATEIRIKGRLDPMIVSYEAGRAIKDMYMNDAIPNTKKIEINDWVGTKSDIKSVWLNKEDFKKSVNQTTDTLAQYRKDRAEIQSLSIQERSERLGFFLMLWSGFTGTNDMPDESILAEAKKLQKKFFENNFYRIVPDPSIFKKMFGKKQCTGMTLQIVESVIRSDISHATKEETYYKSYNQMN